MSGRRYVHRRCRADRREHLMAPGYSVVYVLAWCGSAVSPSHDLVPDPALTDKRLVFILNAPETPRQKERERERETDRVERATQKSASFHRHGFGHWKVHF